MHSPGESTDGEGQGAGGFQIGQLLPVDEHQRSGVLFRKGGQRVADELGAEVGVAAGAGNGCGVLGEGDGLFRTGSVTVLEVTPIGDPVEPAAEFTCDREGGPPFARPGETYPAPGPPRSRRLLPGA